MTNVPSPVFTDTGLAIPAEADVVAGLWADFAAAFGSGLNQSAASPQGQLVTSLAAMIGATNDLLLSIVNQVDPAFASGRMQDAIARIYFLARKGPLATVVTATCVGAAGTLIPQGALALATDGTIYESTGDATIASGGSVDVQFQAIVTGAIPCPTGTLTKIYRTIPGWDSITNAADGVPGRDTETRAAFEDRRSGSVAVNGLGVLPSIRAAITNVEDVLDAYVTENPTASPVTNGAITLPAHSVYVAVQGGADADVARSIWQKKAPGCAYVGNTTVTVKDTSSGYDVPYPSYNVTFQRPTALPIFFAVSLTDNGLVPANASDQVKAAIVSAFSGGDGGPRGRIGATMYASRFYSAVAALGPWVQIVSITIGITSSPTGFDVAVGIDKYPTIDPTDIVVTLA
jgi:uncharacterized phage protein gp47/JayE